MKREQARQSFLYHADRIVAPTGDVNPYHERMRLIWARAIDSGRYRTLPSDPVQADCVLRKEAKSNV